ncbi:MAG: hypothetical protein IKU78_03745 [Paludibacteraceae bacterium]|nr:hypothetical protein [Paludibacteraceae bacterium]
MAIDFDKVETVFEHNLTKEEHYGLFAFEDMTREKYIRLLKSMYKNDEDIMFAINALLYALYYFSRKDKKKAMEYADRLPDCDAKWFSVMNHCLQ